MYPNIRLRRNRKTPWIRDILAETSLCPENLILPVFVVNGTNIKEEIKEMPGVYRQSIDQVIITAKKACSLGILGIAIFPVIENELKNETACEAFNDNNLACNCIRALKKEQLNIGIICDVALDPYTIHGHDGILKDNEIHNDLTLEILCKQALSLAKAGVDIVAPSDMMDGRILSIRNTLDSEGFENINILSYAAKYSSCFYSPFRGALNNYNKKIDKSTYQMDIRNIKEALKEIEYDIKEGADFIMVKPATAFLDIIYAAYSKFNINIFAYHVSGEYSMLKHASIAGILDWDTALLETLICIKRAGATAIFTYAAIEAAELIKKNYAIK